jgi:hypothetical protein
MHPREGWQADGSPPRGWPTRRSFLRGGAAAGLLAAQGRCSRAAPPTCLAT